MQREVWAKIIDTPKRMRIRNVDRQKRDLLHAHFSGERDECRKLPIIGALNRDAHAYRDISSCGRADSGTDVAKCV